MADRISGASAGTGGAIIIGTNRFRMIDNTAYVVMQLGSDMGVAKATPFTNCNFEAEHPLMVDLVAGKSGTA